MMWRKLGLSALVLILLAGGLELALRIAGFEHPPPPPLVLWTPWQDKAFEKPRALFMRDQDALWVLRPQAKIQPPFGVEGSGETVDAAGFRGPELPLERTPGVLRVATLGDSSTFGYGVAWADTYSARLVGELAAHDVPCEVICGGIVGYTILQGIERYRSDVRPYRPDVVVAAFGAVNEHFGDVPDRVKLASVHAESGFAYGLRQGLREHVRVLHLTAYLGERLRPAPPPPAAVEGSADTEPGSESFRGQRRVALDEFEAALRELHRVVTEDGADIVFVSMPRMPDVDRERPVLLRYSERLAKVAEEEGWPFLDAHRLFLERSQEAAEPLPIPLMGDLFHPSPAGHALIAAEIAARILALRRGG